MRHVAEREFEWYLSGVLITGTTQNINLWQLWKSVE